MQGDHREDGETKMEASTTIVGVSGLGEPKREAPMTFEEREKHLKEVYKERMMELKEVIWLNKVE